MTTADRVRNRWETAPTWKDYTGYFDYQVDRKEKIATVTMRQNERGQNIMPQGSELHLLHLIDEWERDDDVKVVVFKSDGINFCTGHDLGSYLDDHDAESRPKAEIKQRHRRTNRRALIEATHLWRPRLLMSLKPTIAMVHGQCIEAGMAINMHVDMTIASDDAHFGHLGQVAGMSGIVPGILYLAAMGYKRFRETMTSGRTYSGAEAVEMGIANRIVPRAQLEEETYKEAKRIAIIPLDGLVTGKMSARLGLMNLGAHYSEEVTHTMWSGFMPNVKHERDEFHFFDLVREKGLSGAIRARQALYEPLGGFGVKGESPRIQA
jgi:enoyl-CoA hydratase